VVWTARKSSAAAVLQEEVLLDFQRCRLQSSGGRPQEGCRRAANTLRNTRVKHSKAREGGVHVVVHDSVVRATN